jgi:hypothetical protein
LVLLCQYTYRPLHLLLAALTYLLGASIPAYLGKPFLLAPFVLGFAGILLAQGSMALLGEVFRPHNEPLVAGETPNKKRLCAITCSTSPSA